jgi:hypothetical protein
VMRCFPSIPQLDVEGIERMIDLFDDPAAFVWAPTDEGLWPEAEGSPVFATFSICTGDDGRRVDAIVAAILTGEKP